MVNFDFDMLPNGILPSLRSFDTRIRDNAGFCHAPCDARIGKTWERRTTSDVSRCLPLSQRPNDQSHMAETPCENPMAHVHGKAMFV